MGFPCGSAGKESACNARDLGLIPGWGRFPEEGKGFPLQYSSVENIPAYIVHGVAKSQTQLSDFHFLFFFFSGLKQHIYYLIVLEVRVETKFHQTEIKVSTGLSFSGKL